MLVFGSIYQGAILVHFFEPQPFWIQWVWHLDDLGLQLHSEEPHWAPAVPAKRWTPDRSRGKDLDPENSMDPHLIAVDPAKS